ncbi:hypothetical protein Glove_303g68 [Diversispora epigaea]|uniref:Uncharacterized protein n=1 Tax=Diversispora epigaea TaxID=1348612 RepID=A0A397HUW9_9GLOM|nr:hypothetical protein Glove_303g68 [Diversispora epigaea]
MYKIKFESSDSNSRYENKEGRETKVEEEYKVKVKKRCKEEAHEYKKVIKILRKGTQIKL